MTEEDYMREALEEAMKAYALEEVPIGAVVVHEGKVIGRGYNRRNTDKSTLAHAELTAIMEASAALGDWRLEGCTMVVTLEPCPMCAGAIVQARMDKVVVGAPNHKAGSGGTLMDILRFPGFNHQVEVREGVLLEECRELLQRFFRELRERKKA
ncbi:tRNA adenosine(34) deaminase TadA [Anaerotalea alkaliphila]|uniref:tRNA-specific adenosine deaminase n=1 Tax=Anaerotalea alkaliphila TaxID=2662126 RepID=A0A7X5HTG1_9FIRM|nr:tRNA adenosine(34) deaminase TadA [Anaerotalea alkaliphila]NDL66357.1 nucleoside deaminase [Anaerotalea alkaliphila]